MWPKAGQSESSLTLCYWRHFSVSLGLVNWDEHLVYHEDRAYSKDGEIQPWIKTDTPMNVLMTLAEKERNPFFA